MQCDDYFVPAPRGAEDYRPTHSSSRVGRKVLIQAVEVSFPCNIFFQIKEIKLSVYSNLSQPIFSTFYRPPSSPSQLNLVAELKKYIYKKITNHKYPNKKCFGFCSYIIRKSIKLAALPPVMSQEFFKKYFLANISNSKGLEASVIRFDAQAAVICYPSSPVSTTSLSLPPLFSSAPHCTSSCIQFTPIVRPLHYNRFFVSGPLQKSKTRADAANIIC